MCIRDRIKRFWKWRSEAHYDLEAKSPQENKDTISPYFVDFGHKQKPHPNAVVGIPTGTSLYGDKPSTVKHHRGTATSRGGFISDNGDIDVSTGENVGTYGIKQNYLQETPAAHFPPINYKNYAKALVFDEVIKKTFFDKEFKFKPAPNRGTYKLEEPVMANIEDKSATDDLDEKLDQLSKEPDLKIASIQSNDVKQMNITEVMGV